MNVLVELPSVLVERSIDAVFTFISEMENGPLWDRTIRTVKDSVGPVAVGTVFREWAQGEDQVLEKVTEVTECDRPTNFSYLSRYENGMTERARISFERVGEATRIVPVAQVEIPGVPQAEEEVFSEAMESEVGRLLANLKAVLEAEQPLQ